MYDHTSSCVFVQYLIDLLVLKGLVYVLKWDEYTADNSYRKTPTRLAIYATAPGSWDRTLRGRAGLMTESLWPWFFAAITWSMSRRTASWRWMRTVRR